MIEITSNDLENLSERPDAPSLLADLMQRLVHCTVPLSKISEISFPKKIYKKGWDGRLVCEEGNPWVPQGKSFWEYSVARSVRRKFESDFAKRTEENIKEQDMRESAFIFVTTRKNPRLNIKPKEWKDVRILDSEELAEWLNAPESLSVRLWLAEKIGKPTKGLISIDIAWERWAKSGSIKSIPKSLILADRENSIEELKKISQKQPN